MTKVSVHNTQGEKVSEIELDPSVFSFSVNAPLLKQVYVALMANRRRSTAKTKDRGERAGSGRKPWRQKGTGRARAGSVRSPLWRKGGVVFGPTNERNHKKAIPHKMKRKAVSMAFFEKVRSGHVIVVDDISTFDGKTKSVSNFLQKVAGKKKVCCAFSALERTIIPAFRNIPTVSVCDVQTLNLCDLLDHSLIVLSQNSLSTLEKKYRSFL